MSVTYTKVAFQATPTSVVIQTTEDTHTLPATATPTIPAATNPTTMATDTHTLPAIPTAATTPMIMATEAIITILTITTHTNVKMDKESEDARKFKKVRNWTRIRHLWT